jgi:hypothetical protein
MSTFSHRVLFIKPDESESIESIKQVNARILERLRSIESLLNNDHGLMSVNLLNWKAHVTVAKLKPEHKQLSLKLDYLSSLESVLGNVQVPLLSIDLLSMRETDETGYYKSYYRIDLLDKLDV